MTESQHRRRARRASLPAPVAAAGILALWAGSAAVSGESSLEPVRLMLLWTPQAQFAGCLVAVEKGFFRKRGLDVEIIPGGPDRDPVEYLLKEKPEEKADLAILWLTMALGALDEGVPLAHVAQVFNRSHLAMVGWKDRGVRTIQDLQDRRVSVWGGSFRPAFDAFFRSQGVKPKKIITQYSTVNLFLRRGIDGCSVMDYNEYHVLYQCGVDPSQISHFSLRNHGANFPEDGIYCLRSYREAHPGTCRAVKEANLEGWKYASEHPEEALDIVMARIREARLPTNRMHMRWMLRAVLPSIFPEDGTSWKPGILSRKQYEETRKWLLRLEVIRRAPTYEEFLR